MVRKPKAKCRKIPRHPIQHCWAGRLKRNITLSALLLLYAASAAAELPLAKEYQSLDKRIQTIKSGVLGLGQDLSMLNKDSLATSSNPLVVYLSLDIDDIFELQAIELALNGNFIIRKEMTPDIISALQHRGALRVFSKELPQGDYELKATMIGKVGKGRDHRPSTVLTFSKENRFKIVELRVSNARERFLPEFVVREWD